MSDLAYGCAIQSINEDETGRMYIINYAGRNSKLFQMAYRCIQEVQSCFKNDVDCIRKFHYHIYEYVKGHAPFGGAHCSSSKGDYFWAVLQMPQQADVVANNPGLSRNKGCGKRIRGPPEIAIEK
ncbi:hypothetical protein QQ045_028711 [Rhodiola kirilowii]